MKKRFELIVINTEWEWAIRHIFETKRDRAWFVNGHQWATDDSSYSYLFPEQKSLEEYNKENGANVVIKVTA